MRINPKHNHVVIKQQDETEAMYGNIIVPDAGKEKPLMGEVIAIGPGLRSGLTGEIIPMETKVGEIVAFPSFGGQRITVKGEEYLIYKDQDIFGSIED
jgi:chaperonin GroES